VARRRRIAPAGLCFHVMNRAAKRAPLFDCEGDYQAFEKVLCEGISHARVAIFSYCLMPNHWHLVVSPVADGHLSRFMHWVSTTHARRWQLARGLNGHGAVYQSRFKALPIQDDHHFLWVCRYVERNPLRAGLVSSAEQWRWSSLGCPDALRDQVIAEWPAPVPPDWTAWVNTPHTYEELGLQKFRVLVRTNEPFGDESWQDTVKVKLGVTPGRRRGRPHRAASVLNK
jgi:putative transposase